MTYLAEVPPPSTDGYRALAVGDPAPWFVQACKSNPRFVFDAAAGRYIVLCFLMSAGTDAGQRALAFVSANRSRFDDDTIAFFGDPTHKRRVDCLIEDPAIIAAVEERIRRRVVPEIRKAYQFEATRLERYLIGCYRARDGGHFAAHRDNTTPRTAHRRFALTIQLNDDFEGGELSFPEYGSRSYRPPVGGAVAFSCSLLHAVSRVTSGDRYALLPFLHDEAAERQMAAPRVNDGAPPADARV